MQLRYLIAPALVALCLLLSAIPALAQLDSGQYQITQNGLVAGAVYVPDRDPQACEYREYWYLHTDYVYPSATNGASFTLEPADSQVETFEAFLAEVEKAHPGGRLVIVDSMELKDGC